MTDGPGTAAIWLGIVFSALAIQRGGARWWVGATAALLGAICLRTALLPLVLYLPAFALLVRAATSWRRGGRALALALRAPVLFAAVVALELVLYAEATGRVSNSPPQLNPRSGTFLLGTVAPILAPEDFAGLGMRDPAALLQETRHQEYRRRNAQIFTEDGLATMLERELGSWQAVSKAGAVLARRSVLRDPVGYARLVLASGAEYLSPEVHRAVFTTGYGLNRPLSPPTLAFLRGKVRDQLEESTPWAPSPVLSWLRLLRGVLPVEAWLALLLPLASLLPHRRSPGAREGALLLASCAWVHLLSVFALGTEPAQRYLLPVLPIVMVLIALELERLLPRLNRGD